MTEALSFTLQNNGVITKTPQTTGQHESKLNEGDQRELEAKKREKRTNPSQLATCAFVRPHALDQGKPIADRSRA